ncbi:unnamed protein product [Somion occarium]|uniref:Uncharacterized protein n=1 Tax=Somion occarium TaxID=3059160 RepID=A0ABP1DYV5_9APHY
MFSTKAFTFVVAAAMLLVGQVQAGANIPRAALIATNPVAACNPPNNGNHHLGSSCKFFSGPSDKSPVVSGTCINENGVLTCVRG